MKRLLYLSFLFTGFAIYAFAQPPVIAGKKKETKDQFNEKYLTDLLQNIDVSVKSGNWEKAAELSLEVDNIYYNQFRYEETAKYASQAITFAKKGHFIKSQIVGFNDLGYAHFQRFNYPAAIEYF